MTTAATITANLVLDSKKYQQGIKEAEKATTKFQSKFSGLTNFIRANAATIDKMGDSFREAGKRMTTFISLPILVFFTMLISKAMGADTAMGTLARETVAKLNAQLVILGEKFLPIVIKALEFMVETLEKFNNAPPWVQKLVVGFVILLGLAGPLTGFIGTIMNLVAYISSIGPALTGIIPAITGVGSAIWGALLPLLPIILAVIAIVAGLAFVIWAFATDFMGVTTTLKQLFFIIGYEFKKLGEGMKQGWSDAMDWLDKQADKSASTWRKNFEQAGQIIQKVFKIAIDFMLKTFFEFTIRFSQKLMEIRNWATNAWNSITSAFYSAFNAIANFANSVFSSIVDGVNWVIDAIGSLTEALSGVEVPDDLTPGSPTPFEIGLRGIAKAMDTLSRTSIPEMNAAFSPSGVSDVGTQKTINIVDNRRFAAGMDAKTLRTALDRRFEGLSQVLESM